MTAQLKLSSLAEVRPLGFVYRSLTFDMVSVGDLDFKAQLAQVIDLGFTAAATSAALREETELLQGSGGPRTIRFYSSQQDMSAGTGTSPRDPGDSGASSWRGPKGAMDNESPISARTDLRVFIDPTGGTGVSVPAPDGSYHAPLWALVGTTWHELHHLATTQHHKEGQWPYSGGWAVAMDRIKAGLPRMIWDPIARKMVSINTQGWHVENFGCGCRAVA